ncbi:hypothetical protein BDZ91DRAFT_725383 [Kalaharituber pfeilii]|nr:hypothetical protein BDZ91DRAFT_725383 [Kalaharituber pfeilii]
MDLDIAKKLYRSVFSDGCSDSCSTFQICYIVLFNVLTHKKIYISIQEMYPLCALDFAKYLYNCTNLWNLKGSG